MNENKTNARENDDLQRFYRAMVILRQKIDTLLKSIPNLLTITDLKALPAEKAEVVENQLWDIFVYGEYYVERIRTGLIKQSIIPTTGAGKPHFEYHQQKYQSFIRAIKHLIDVSNAPERKDVEIAVINETSQNYFDDPYSSPEITDRDIADGIDIDDYKELASNGWIQTFIRTHIANHVEGHASTSDENIPIKTGFETMLDVVRNYQAEIKEEEGPAIIEFETLEAGILDDPIIGKVIEEEHKNEKLAYDLKVSDCEKIINKPYFKPDDWVANEKELSPVIVDRDLEKIPDRIQKRIHEIHSSFIFGHWMSVIALSRCLLEYAIIHRKSLLKIELYRDPDKNRRKPLAELVDDAKKASPEIAKGERIIEAGNRVMHPSPRGILSKFPPGKADAKDCMNAITEIISTLYSKPKNTGNPFN